MKNLILAFLILASNNCISQENYSIEDNDFCNELAKYRDNELFNDFSKISNKYEINYQAKIDMSNIKNQLLDDNKWQMSNAGNAFAQLMSLTKGTCDIILTALPASKANKAILESYKIYKLISYGKKAEKFIKNDFEQFVFDEGIKKILADFNPILSITNDVLKTVNGMNNLDKDWKSYKETIKIQVKKLNEQIKIYEVKLKQYSEDFEKINKFKNFIDNYIQSNCKSSNSSNTSSNKTQASDLLNSLKLNISERIKVVKDYFIKNEFNFIKEGMNKDYIGYVIEFSDVTIQLYSEDSVLGANYDNKGTAIIVIYPKSDQVKNKILNILNSISEKITDDGYGGLMIL